ncbi:phosphotransferase [Actinoplanes sp. NPDC051470]|uniref:phosphotransferase enzyme family protein n=1 Tax=Actinoplanes sp. NPDC051470 TaxID=3157224 RepID=UPI00341E24E5
MPDDDLLRSLLRDHWHLAPSRITALEWGQMSCAWEVLAGDERYVCRLVDDYAARPVEAGLAAAEHLRDWGIAVGAPVRTLAGALTATTSTGVLSVSHRVPGRSLAGCDPVDQQWWGDRLGAMHRVLQRFHHPGLRAWQLIDLDAPHLGVEPWLRPAVTDAVNAAVRLTVTDRLTYGVLHGDPAPAGFVVDPDTGRAGLFTCGASGTGPLAYDVAAAVVYAGGPPAAAEFLDGYLAAGPVHRDEVEAALPVLIRFRWAVQADWSARQLAGGGACPAEARQALATAREALESPGL